MLVAVDAVFDVKQAPSILLQGPVFAENAVRRTPVWFLERDVPALSYEESNKSRLYHLDFDFITTATEWKMHEFQKHAVRFYQVHTALDIPQEGTRNLTEISSLDGLKHVNLTNLCQANARAQIKDCPVYDGSIHESKPIHDCDFQYAGGIEKTRIRA